VVQVDDKGAADDRDDEGEVDHLVSAFGSDVSVSYGRGSDQKLIPELVIFRKRFRVVSAVEFIPSNGNTQEEKLQNSKPDKIKPEQVIFHVGKPSPATDGGSQIPQIVSEVEKLDTVEKTDDSELGGEARHAQVEQAGTGKNIIGEL